MTTVVFKCQFIIWCLFHPTNGTGLYFLQRRGLNVVAVYIFKIENICDSVEMYYYRNISARDVMAVRDFLNG